jgi:hypothetical protein
MKGFIIVACTLILGSGSFAGTSGNFKVDRITNGKNSGRPISFTDSKIFKSAIYSLAALDSTFYIRDVKNISARALKDFQVRFDDASEVIWYSNGNGFTSYFTKDGFRDRVFYNKNGRWQYSLIYYAQDKLPQNVRTKVKSSHPDFDIDIVVEMQSIYGMAYVVYMESKSNIRILKVNADGEMETMMDLVRG